MYCISYHYYQIISRNVLQEEPFHYNCHTTQLYLIQLICLIACACLKIASGHTFTASSQTLTIIYTILYYILYTISPVQLCFFKDKT